jgi:hypothetical protein
MKNKINKERRRSMNAKINKIKVFHVEYWNLTGVTTKEHGFVVKECL